MKLLLINSSARADGNTQRVLALFERHLKAIAHEKSIELEITQIHLARLTLKACRGCRVCFDRGEQFCPDRDDLLALYEAMRSADGYLFASPIYVEDINGIMKTMIDRLAFLCHRPQLYGKSAMLITTSGIGSSRHALQTMSKAFGTWGIKTVLQSQFRLGALTGPEEILLRYGAQIEQMSQLFLARVLQTPFRPSAYSLIAFSVQQAMWSRKDVDPNSIDYRFWRDEGWLAPRRRYYIGSLSASPRAVMLHAVGRVIALFFG